jgi:hypothetical protein
MLILDVKTRWSSTHQMMSRVLDLKDNINFFVARNRDLRDLELLPIEWDAIAHVANWLYAFRSATTDMSTTKMPMLSTTHVIFWGLQAHIQQVFWDLPPEIPPRIKQGLLDAHRKLSDYYYKYDNSPFYIWAARK